MSMPKVMLTTDQSLQQLFDNFEKSVEAHNDLVEHVDELLTSMDGRIKALEHRAESNELLDDTPSCDEQPAASDEPVHDIIWAAIQLKDWKAVKRKFWIGHYITRCDGIESYKQLTVNDILATDWEIVD